MVELKADDHLTNLDSDDPNTSKVVHSSSKTPVGTNTAAAESEDPDGEDADNEDEDKPTGFNRRRRLTKSKEPDHYRIQQDKLPVMVGDLPADFLRVAEDPQAQQASLGLVSKTIPKKVSFDKKSQEKPPDDTQKVHLFILPKGTMPLWYFW